MLFATTTRRSTRCNLGCRNLFLQCLNVSLRLSVGVCSIPRARAVAACGDRPTQRVVAPASGIAVLYRKWFEYSLVDGIASEGIDEEMNEEMGRSNVQGSRSNDSSPRFSPRGNSRALSLPGVAKHS